MGKRGRWLKERKTIRHYEKTEQQKKIEEVGRKISEKCTGLKGTEFQICRSDAIREVLKRVEGKKYLSLTNI